MTYTIRYRKDGEITHQDLWNGPLERAQEIAAKAVADGTAKYAEVRDENDQLLAYYPHVPHRG